MATQEVSIKVQDNGKVRELEGQELADYLAQLEADKAEFEAQLAIKEALKLEKLKILDRLGITEEEAKLILS